MIIAEFLRLQKSLFAPPARNRRRENKRICSGNAFLMFFYQSITRWKRNRLASLSTPNIIDICIKNIQCWEKY